MRHDDMEGRLCDFDNYDDLEHHVFHFCSESMIAKKLLVHVEKHLASIGLNGIEELKHVDIPGIANPFDSRYTRPGSTHQESVVQNWMRHRRALALESKSILEWVHAFNVCRAHQITEKAGGKGKKVVAEEPDQDVRDQSLADVIAESNAAAEASKFVGRLEYNLPGILRPLITETLVSGVNATNAEIPAVDLFHGFQEGAVTLVCRPVVSEDYFLDFSRGYDMGTLPPLVRIVLLDFTIGCSDPEVAECVLSDADIVPLTTLGRQHRFFSTDANCMDSYVRQDVFSSWNTGFVRHQDTMRQRYSNDPSIEPWCLTKMLMEKAGLYAKQAIQFHCSNISDGIYRSEILTHILEVLASVS